MNFCIVTISVTLVKNFVTTDNTIMYSKFTTSIKQTVFFQYSGKNIGIFQKNPFYNTPKFGHFAKRPKRELVDPVQNIKLESRISLNQFPKWIVIWQRIATRRGG